MVTVDTQEHLESADIPDTLASAGTAVILELGLVDTQATQESADILDIVGLVGTLVILA